MPKNPGRCFSQPGFLSWLAHFRQADRVGLSSGDGGPQTISFKTGRRGPCRGLRCRAAGLIGLTVG